MPIALDSSCLVAALSSWHSEWEKATATIDSLLATDLPLVIPAPALVEAYSVLTRLPSPLKVSPSAALTALIGTFGPPFGSIVSLSAASYLEVLAQAAEQDLAGGMIYDAIIAHCAREAGATSLLTLNPKHFARFAAPDLRIIVPG